MEESTLHISRGDKCIVRLTFLLKVTEIIDGRVDFRNKGVKGFVLLVRKPFFKIMDSPKIDGRVNFMYSADCEGNVKFKNPYST